MKGRFLRREALYHMQRGRCFYCNCKMALYMPKPGEKASDFMCTEDHLVPQSVGGSDARENLVAACFLCNNIRGAIHWNDFKWFVDKYGRGSKPHVVFMGLDKKGKDYLDNQLRWRELTKPIRWVSFRHSEGKVADYGHTFTPVNPGIKPIVIRVTGRRSFVSASREAISDIVNAFPYWERNSIWLSYLVKEKGKPYASSD